MASKENDPLLAKIHQFVNQMLQARACYLEIDIVHITEVYSIYMAALISIISRRGFIINVHCRNQADKNKLLLYNTLPLL